MKRNYILGGRIRRLRQQEFMHLSSPIINSVRCSDALEPLKRSISLFAPLFPSLILSTTFSLPLSMSPLYLMPSLSFSLYISLPFPFHPPLGFYLCRLYIPLSLFLSPLHSFPLFLFLFLTNVLLFITLDCISSFCINKLKQAQRGDW